MLKLNVLPSRTFIFFNGLWLCMTKLRTANSGHHSGVKVKLSCFD